MVALIVVAVVVVFALFVASRAVRVIPQAKAGVVERLGRYSRTLEPGLAIVTPFVDRVRPLVDLREQVVNFSPQSVITEDNVVVAIETVLYFTITDPRGATYEIANPLQAIEQLTVTTLRNVIGGLTLEATLTARENVNAEGERQAAILRAEGEAKAIDTVFTAIHEGKPDRELLSYEYLQMLPQLAEGDANKVFVVPSEFASAFGGIGETLARAAGRSPLPPPPAPEDGSAAKSLPAPEDAGAAKSPPPPEDAAKR